MTTYLAWLVRDIRWEILMITDPIHLVSLRTNSPELAEIWDDPLFQRLHGEKWPPLLNQVWAAGPEGELKIRTLMALAVFADIKETTNLSVITQLLRYSILHQDQITAKHLMTHTPIINAVYLANLFESDDLIEDEVLIVLHQITSTISKSADHFLDCYYGALLRSPHQERIARLCFSSLDESFLRYLVKHGSIEQYLVYQPWERELSREGKLKLIRAAASSGSSLLEYLLDRFSADYTGQDLDPMLKHADTTILPILFQHGARDIFEAILRAAKYKQTSRIAILRAQYQLILASLPR